MFRRRIDHRVRVASDDRRSGRNVFDSLGGAVVATGIRQGAPAAAQRTVAGRVRRAHRHVGRGRGRVVLRHMRRGGRAVPPSALRPSHEQRPRLRTEPRRRRRRLRRRGRRRRLRREDDRRRPTAAAAAPANDQTGRGRTTAAAAVGETFAADGRRRGQRQRPRRSVHAAAATPIEKASDRQTGSRGEV